MDVKQLNQALAGPDVEPEQLLPHLVSLRDVPHVFDVAFGLDALPEEPGLISVRGARQYGKSTWLEGQLAQTIREHGPGSAFYLNGDFIATEADLGAAIRDLVAAFRRDAAVRRLFIDEITAVDGWARALKALIDAGELRGVLVVTTGSRATDLRRGTERLPGRKGRLERTAYLFTPVPYAEFQARCGSQLGDQTLPSYLLTGGAPLACAEIAHAGRLPEYLVEMLRDWIQGERSASGRPRASLVAVMETLHRLGGTPIGQARLARESGLANNTVAAGYLELLADLNTIGLALPWDASRRVRLRRKRAKYPFINLLAAVAWDPARPRTPAEVLAMPERRQGAWLEWLVAQELWRRAAVRGDDLPEELTWWQSSEHEIDFVVAPDRFVEVKRGRAGPLDFTWFSRRFGRARLTVITSTPFETDQVLGVTMDDFLLDESLTGP